MANSIKIMANSIEIGTCANDPEVQVKANLSYGKILAIIAALDNQDTILAKEVAILFRNAINEDARHNPDSCLRGVVSGFRN